MNAPNVLLNWPSQSDCGSIALVNGNCAVVKLRH